MSIVITTNPVLPTHCEYCGEPLVWESADLVCANKHCPQKEQENLKVWCENIVPIEGLKWTTISKYIYKMYYYKIPTLQEYIATETKATHIYNKEDTSESGLYHQFVYRMLNEPIKISNFLLALNIPGLGKISTKRWEESKNAIRYIEYLLGYVSDFELYEELLKIVQDKNVISSMKLEYRNKLCYYYNLFKNQLVVSNVAENKGEVVITGSLSMLRKDFETLLETHGWTLSNSIKKTTKFLITNTPDSNTSKNKKADELGVTKITELNFSERYLV